MPTADRSRRVAYPSRLRGDIQGLRALAVLLVVADHLVAFPTGGYVGVDVFFVISGFLITGQLLRDVDRHGRVRFGRFWLHRVRRILPAAMATIAVTVVAASVVLGPTRFRTVAVDAFWSTVSLANWHFAAVGTDYSQANGPVSPLQHFWSLGVEEQFYAVWPVLIAVVLLVARGRASRRLLGIVLAVLVVGSFVFAVVQTAMEPTVAYFSTLTRGWELAVGALVAVVSGRLTGLGPRVRTIGAWAGLAVIVVGAVLLDSRAPFPGPWAALPVVGAALVVTSGTGGAARGISPLANPVTGWIGDRSYSIYLWHFPVIVLAGAVVPEGSKRYLLAVVVLTAVLSVLSYRFVETPIRSWRAPDGSRTGRRVRRRGTIAVAGVLVVVVAAGVSVATVRPETVAPVPTIAGSSVGARQLTQQIAAAAKATAWPADLTPTIDAAPTDASAAMTDTHCFNPADPTDATQCTVGSGSKTAVVTGDSISMAWQPAVRAALGSGWRVHAIGYSNCPFIAADVTYAPAPSQGARCTATRQARIDQIKRLHPDVLVISDLELGIDRLNSGATGAEAVREWTAAREQIIDEVRGSVGRVVLIAPNPVGPPLSCADAGAPPSACATTPSDAWKRKAEADRDAAAATGATFVDASDWFCTDAGVCPPFVGRVLVRWDDGHMTTTYAKYIAPLLRRELLG